MDDQNTEAIGIDGSGHACRLIVPPAALVLTYRKSSIQIITRYYANEQLWRTPQRLCHRPMIEVVHPLLVARDPLSIDLTASFFK